MARKLVFRDIMLEDLNPSRAPKWLIIFYFLAGFVIVTVCGGFYLTNLITSIYNSSIVVNQTWATRLAALDELRNLTIAVNAPGNNVFDTLDVDAETVKRDTARSVFQKRLIAVRQEIEGNVVSGQALDLLAGLDAVQIAMNNMILEADLIFTYFRKDEPEKAGRHMATMDRKFAQLSIELAIVANKVRIIQRLHFSAQVVSARELRMYEFVIGVIIILLVGCVSVYGYKIAVKMKKVANGKKWAEMKLHKSQELLEARVLDLQDSEERLEAQAVKVVAIADELSVAKKKMEYLANHDALTGLPSLRLCKDRIDMAMKAARRNKSLCGLIYIDLDGFKAVNDAHGHDAGNAVLKIAAERIQSCIREVDTAARIGGDEFIIVAPGIDKPEDVAVLAERLIDDISVEMTVNGATISIGASIGIALFPTDGTTSEELIQRADKAMYKIKQKDKNNYGFALSA